MNIRLKHLPLKNITVYSPYGKRNITVNDKSYWWHNGVDLKAPLNTPVYAVDEGKVMIATYNNSYGYYVVLYHGKYGTLYSHLRNYTVNSNDRVKAGDIIGYSGSSGDSTGPHLHFEIRLCKYENFWDRAQCDSTVFMNTVDPMLFIEDYLEKQKEITVKEAIPIVQSAAGLEDRTMDYIVNHYKYGDDLVKKLAKAII